MELCLGGERRGGGGGRVPQRLEKMVIGLGNFIECEKLTKEKRIY